MLERVAHRHLTVGPGRGLRRGLVRFSAHSHDDTAEMERVVAAFATIVPTDVLRRLEALGPRPGQRREGEGDRHGPEPDGQ